jgi:NADH:ubiquinone oxidoreductase subunit D
MPVASHNVFMDTDVQAQVIEDRLATLETMPVTDDASARAAFVHLSTTVSRVNHLSAQVQAQAMMGAAGAPVDAILAKLSQWLDRLVTAMTRIVAKLADATSFSVSVGSTVSVTVSFSCSG